MRAICDMSIFQPSMTPPWSVHAQPSTAQNVDEATQVDVLEVCLRKHPFRRRNDRVLHTIVRWYLSDLPEQSSAFVGRGNSQTIRAARLPNDSPPSACSQSSR